MNDIISPHEHDEAASALVRLLHHQLKMARTPAAYTDLAAAARLAVVRVADLPDLIEPAYLAIVALAERAVAALVEIAAAVGLAGRLSAKECLMPKDVYFQPDASDLVLDDTLVLALVRRHVPGAQAVTGVDESGGEARTYAVDDQIILKTQRPHRLRPRTSLAKEAIFLRHLAAFAAIPVPRVLGEGQDGPIEYLCLTRMPGMAVIHQEINEPARVGMLRELGQVLRQIHSIPQEPLIASGQFPGDRTATDLRSRMAEMFGEVLDTLEHTRGVWAGAQPARAVADAALAWLPHTTAFVALHSNPGAEHTFADPLTQTYTGTIDFGDAYISHPALDLRRWKDPNDREALLAGYLTVGPVDDAFMAVWRAAQVWADMAAIATTPEHRDAAHTHIQRMLTET